MTKPMMKIGASALCAVVVACLVVLQTCGYSSGAADQCDSDAARQELGLNEQSGGEEAQENQSTDGPKVRQSNVDNLQYYPECGIYEQYQDRVANGHNAREGEFPSVMELRTVFEFGYEGDELETMVKQCTGVLVSSRIVLTAAHCLALPKVREPIRLKQVWVKPAYFLLHARDFRDGTWTEAINFCMSPDYDDRVPVFDIAVLIMPEQTVFWLNDTVRHVCLPQQITDLKDGLHPATPAWLAGNGQDGPDGDYMTPFPNYVQKLELRRDACGPMSIYSNPHSRGHPDQMHPSTICFMARAIAPLKPGMPCPGDSGGPIIAIKDQRQFLYGIHSMHNGPKCQGGIFVKMVAFDTQVQRNHIDDLITSCRRGESGHGLELAHPPPPHEELRRRL